ncbi:MAG TPA: AsmA family protein [Terriglobales bacterium]
MPGRVSRRALWIWFALGVVLLALFLPPFVNVNRYRNRVASSISNALGRQVTVSNIELELLPRPGMVLSTFVVADDPSYGPEPMLRAETVTAYLRLSSLWRGRLEIGTLALENPSLNLVRRADGHWNLEELVQRTSQASSAPTAKARPESRPRFPYVEAKAGRINFKLGQVKKAFAFSDADFALWLESENEWGIRLEARPMRSDVPVSDTGTLRMEGRFQSASSLRSTPLNLNINFTKGQLGQITALIYGRDRGWRGGVTSTATLTGTPASLAVTIDATVSDFRRYDIALGEALRLSVHCTGTYSSPNDSIRDIQCQAPVRPGILMVRGSVIGWAGQEYDLGISAEQIPLDRIVALARHTKKDLPDDLTATGTTDGVFTVHKNADSAPVWAGGGRTTQFALQSKVLKPDLELGEVEFSIPEAPATTGGKRSRKFAKPLPGASTGDSLRVVVKPFPVPLGATSPATAGGYFDLQHYRITLDGDAEMARLMSIAKAMGIVAPAIGLAGPSQLNLEIAGAWTGFASPAPSGKVQLRNATAELQGVGEPLEIASATATLAEQAVTISPFSAGFKDGTAVSGSASFPLHCGSPGSCLLHFDLHTPEISLARLNQLLNPTYQSQPWYHLLAIGQRDENALMKLHAQGRVSAGQLVIGDLVATNFNSAVDMSSGKLSLKDMRADLLGGHHSGNWDADFTTAAPKYFGSGTVTKLVMAQVSALMHDPWATGTLDGQYTLGLAGMDAAALRASATGSASFKWIGGFLRHVVLEAKSAPLSFSSFGGQVALRNGSLGCEACKLQSTGETFDVTGSASFGRTLDVRLESSGQSISYTISGPLDQPHVESVPSPHSEAKAR